MSDGTDKTPPGERPKEFSAGARGTSFEAAALEQLQRLAAQFLRRRSSPHDPGTLSLVDGVVLRLLRAQKHGKLPEFGDEAALTAYMARAVRNHCVSLARQRAAQRRPPERRREAWPESEYFPATRSPPALVLDVSEALDELAQVDPRSAQIVELMFFGGATQAEAAAALGATVDQVRGDWEFARAWLKRRLGKLARD